jgi:outer membrane protein TolC
MVRQELTRWGAQLKDKPDPDPAQARRKLAAYEELSRVVPEARAGLGEIQQATARAVAELSEDRRDVAWQRLNRLARQLDAAAAELYVLQTRIRVNLIQLEPVEWQAGPAIQYALANRLDLMNQRAQVVDAWRQITVTASALKAGLNLVFNANVATPPDSSNPFDFRASASRYRVGFQFDGPLNRLAERNAYRASLVNYQQARRAYMALSDQIVQAIRRDLRNLENFRLNFEITRQSLVSAARQVEFAREQLLSPERGAADASTATLNILNALSSLLGARSALIGNWVAYESGRMQLLLDLEALQLDARGLPTHEHDQPDSPATAAPELCGPLAP